MRLQPHWVLRCEYRWLACVAGRLLLLSLAGTMPAGAQEVTSSGSVQWRTGADFQKQLQTVTSVQWREAELRQRLQNLAAVHRIAIFLDRRIDPQQEIDFASTGIPLEILLNQLALQLNAATARIGPVIYLGPPQTAGALAAAAPQRRKELARHRLPSRRRVDPWGWPVLAEPRQILLDLAQDHKLAIANPQAIPHDLWPTVDLPPLELADRLTLLLAGFDLTFELDGSSGTVKLVPLPADAAYEQTYSVPADAEEVASALKREFPKLALRREGRRLVVRGTYAEHQRIAARLAGTATASATSAKDNTRYTLTVRNESAGAVVSTVARRLGKQLQCSAAVREKLAKKVTFVVRDATLDELMSQTLDSLNLQYKVTEDALEVLEEEP